MGTAFFVIIGLLSAIGTALVYGLGGYLVIQKAFTIGTIVAFGAYLGNLYAALQGLATAPVDFATSMVSFERVFEVIDLPLDIRERPDARPLSDVEGRLAFEDVCFRYEVDEDYLLSQVSAWGQMDNVQHRSLGLSAEQTCTPRPTGIQTTRKPRKPRKMKRPGSAARRAWRPLITSLSRSNRASWWPWSGRAAREKRP